MAKPLPTNSGIITSGLLRAAVALQVAVYEYKDCTLGEKEAIKAVEHSSKEIERLTCALRRTI